ncbi:unnamed protein product [Lepeophtheirus salmonis]|uniref:(salmon louse) hypothetical protein n=1 Tax=Lepeophtheirus salmonis TaxID=72036 RepID=A0A7R8CYR6_LEPSM|nr:unnamed protein product [Lepeophtheirus salmonis]CAF2971213.1 unnamed protein product [Lepeophtheirus salmonis]
MHIPGILRWIGAFSTQMQGRIVEDFVLRFGWAISLSLTEMGYVHENEHLNNCGKFRAVRDISVTPMDASDQSQILKMMDESHGVMHVRRRKTGKKHYEPLKALVETSDDQSR